MLSVYEEEEQERIRLPEQKYDHFRRNDVEKVWEKGNIGPERKCVLQSGQDRHRG